VALSSSNVATNGLQLTEQAVVGHAPMKAWTASSYGLSPAGLVWTFFLYMFSSATILVLSTTFRWWKYSALALVSGEPSVKSVINSLYASEQVLSCSAPGSVISASGAPGDWGQFGAVTTFLLMLDFDL
jgi:hypothetical protein